METIAEFLEMGENVKLPLRECRFTPQQWGLVAEGYLGRFYATSLNHALLLAYNRCENEEDFLECFLFKVNTSYAQQIDKEKYSEVQKLIDATAAYLYRGVIRPDEETPLAIYESPENKLPITDKSLLMKIRESIRKRYVAA